MDLTPRSEGGHLRFSTSELVEFWERSSAHSNQFYGGTPRKSREKGEACSSPFELYSIQSDIQNEDVTLNGDSQNESHSIAPNLDIADMEDTTNICCETDSFSPLATARVRLSMKRKHSSEISEDRTPIKGRKTSSVVDPRILKTMAPKVIVTKTSIYKNAKRNATSSSGASTSNVFDQNKVTSTPFSTTPRRALHKRLQVVGGEMKFAYFSPITGMKRLEKPSTVTKPKPFSFYSRDMTKEKSVKKQEREPDFKFKAKAPTVLRKEPFIPVTRPRRILDFRAPSLRTENRAKKRSEIHSERENKIRELDMKLVKLEREAIRQIRKTKEFKASGIAWKK